MLPWVVRRTGLPLLSLRCADCRSESATTGAGRFRVNANGKLLDVWLRDPLFARRNRLTLDWTGAWRLDTASEWTDQAWPVQMEVRFEDPVPVRPDRLIAHGLGLSRNAVSRRIKCDVPLRRPTSTTFTFTVISREQRLPVLSSKGPP